MKELISILLIYPLFIGTINYECPDFAYYGAPKSNIEGKQLCRERWAVNYNYKTKTAEYVIEKVTVDDVAGFSKRLDNFTPDPDISEKYSSRLEDYVGSGFDRGHLSPALNNSRSDKIMSESFFLTNIVPQNPNHNRGIWKNLELLVRDWVREGRNIYVINGTYYDEYIALKNNTFIPTHLWKIVVDADKHKAIGFFIPNKPISNKDLKNFIVNIEFIEKKTKIDFHPKLPDELKYIEKDIDYLYWNFNN